MKKTILTAAVSLLLATPSFAVETARQISTHMGEMGGSMPQSGDQETVFDTLRFEPWQMLEEMFLRDDVVFLMRHGPTDWNKLDEKGVGSTDCANQRIMSPEGRDQMRALGNIMAFNDILPAKIVVSEWCRNQQTVEELLAGISEVSTSKAEEMPIETNADLNLLLSLNGAPNVVGLREMITKWEGSDGNGPLLLVSHFTNIEELTTFTVYEGEMLVIDPKRNNRVLGYIRLQSASPDVGHFDVEGVSR